MAKVIDKNMANTVGGVDALPPSNKEEGGAIAKVFLSGVAVTDTGKLTKHNYFDFLHLDLDDYSDLQFTEEEAVRIRGSLGKMKTGATSVIPQTCSPKCPFQDRCPFAQIGKAPTLRACLLEVNLLREWTTLYFNEYQVDPNNFTEIGMINELAEIEVQQWRINQILARAENAEFLVDQVVGVSPQGKEIKSKQIHPIFEVKQQLSAKKARIIKLMVGDRQEKYKRDAALKQKQTEDPSSEMAIARLAIEARIKEFNKTQKAITPPEAIKTPDDIINSSDDE